MVLLNDLGKAKSRLSPALSPAQRQSLVRAMLSDVVAALQQTRSVNAISVMAGCAGGGQLARSLGADPVLDEDLPGQCINTRVAAWLTGARCDAESSFLLVHADVPYLTSDDVETLLLAREQGEVIIATDEKGLGTNAIVMSPGQLPRFAFGDDSARTHAALCREQGQRCRVLRLDGAACDVDTPQDLHAALAAHRSGLCPGPATTLWLTDFSRAVA